MTRQIREAASTVTVISFYRDSRERKEKSRYKKKMTQTEELQGDAEGWTQLHQSWPTE